MSTVEKYIRSIPDFPEQGIIFRDITTVTQDPEGLQLAIKSMEDKIKDKDFDDLIATGGTVKAAINLIERLGGEVVSCLFLTELAGLNGRKALEGYNVESVVVYEGK